MDGDKFSNPARCRSPCFERGIHGADISPDHDRDIALTDVFLADKNDIGRLDHCVRGLNRANQAECFDHSKCFHEVRNLTESLHKSN